MRQVSGSEENLRAGSSLVRKGLWMGEELEKRGKYLTGGERKGSRGNFNCFES